MRRIYVLGEPYFAAYSFEAYPHTVGEQSLALAQKIFDIREKVLLETVIRRRYPHWQKEEITELARRAGQWIAEDLLACPLFAGPQRLRLCGKKLACSLEAVAGPFSVEGFCRFSFPHYRSYLQTSVAEAVAAWQGEREQAAPRLPTNRRSRCVPTRVRSRRCVHVQGRTRCRTCKCRHRRR